MPFDPNNFSHPVSPACSTCKHFIDFSNPPRCKAFPGGIPSEILDGDDDHTTPFRGDNGIQYEPITQ